MKKILTIIFFISAMCGFAFAQSSLPTLEKVKQLTLLESTREDAIKLLNNVDVGYNDLPDYHVSYFYAEDANLRVYYSNGACADENEDWNVDEFKVTAISVSPKQYTEIKDIGIDYSKFRKERPRNDYKNLYVYHDKKVGIAIWAYGDGVESVIFSPSEKDFPRLCNRPEVKKYYSSKKYVRDPDMKTATYHNFPPPDVVSLNLSQSEIVTNCNSVNENCSDAKIAVSIEIKNYMSDVLTYDYHISGGKIVGKGTEVVWDLSGVKPGTYKITAVANNGCGPCGKWITKTVVVKECPDCSIKDN